MINSFSFGVMMIDGKEYTSDLIIYPNGRVVDGWRRNRGHNLSSTDIKDLMESGVEVIVAGTGVNGMVQPERGIKASLHRKGIDFIVAQNKNAIAHYNDLSRTKRVGACFHLTC